MPISALNPTCCCLGDISVWTLHVQRGHLHLPLAAALSAVCLLLLHSRKQIAVDTVV